MSGKSENLAENLRRAIDEECRRTGKDQKTVLKEAITKLIEQQTQDIKNN